MLGNLVIGLVTIMICLFLQVAVLIWILRYYRSHSSTLNNPSFWSGLRVIQGVMFLLLVGNMIQIGVWAEIYVILGEFSGFEESFYHSAVNFATLGYGDVVMSEKHKLLGPLQAVNGALMIGVSTGALMTAFQDVLKRTIQSKNPSE
ncbi:MAG: transporter [Planctomycetia bacterium TMED53]|nr:MAG: transporter [Planctomycetia bacterium TMED53]